MNRKELIQGSVANIFAQNVNNKLGLVDGKGKPKKVADRILYVVAEVTAGTTIVNAFDTIERKAVGITNFDKNMLAQGRNAVITEVKLEYGTLLTANYGGTFENTAPFVNFNEAAPAYILNTKLKFTDDEKPLLEFPIKEIHNPNTTRTNDEGYRVLGDLRMIESERELVLALESPKVVSDLDPLKRHFIMLTLRVGESVKR